MCFDGSQNLNKSLHIAILDTKDGGHFQGLKYAWFMVSFITFADTIVVISKR